MTISTPSLPHTPRCWQGADYGYGYSDSPRANDRHGGGGGGGGDFGGPWASAPSHGVDEYGYAYAIRRAAYACAIRV